MVAQLGDFFPDTICCLNLMFSISKKFRVRLLHLVVSFSLFFFISDSILGSFRANFVSLGSINNQGTLKVVHLLEHKAEIEI